MLSLPEKPRLALQSSYRIGSLDNDTALWQVGTDMLEPFSDLVHRTYNITAGRYGKVLSREPIHEAHQEWIERTIFLATIGPDGMSGSGAGVLLYDGDSYFVPSEFKSRVDFEALQRQYNAREIWIGTRNSVESSFFASPSKALRAMKAIIDVGYGNILRRPDCLIFAQVADNIYKRWLRMGYKWKNVPGGKVPHPVIEGLMFNPIILETNDPWI